MSQFVGCGCRGAGDDRENMDPSAAPVRLPPPAFKPATDQQIENKFIKRVKNMIDAGLSDDQVAVLETLPRESRTQNL